MPFPARNRLALALTLGLHALLALFWLQAPRPRLADAPRAPSVVSVLLNVPLPLTSPAAAPAAAPSSPARAPKPARRAPPPAAIPPKPAALPATTPSPAPAPSSQVAPDTSPSASSTASTASVPDTAESSAASPAPSDAGLALDLARRQAGRVDRELRKGKSGVPAEADTPWARFQRGLDAAHAGNLAGEQMDSYTAPDGVVIYRRRIGKRTVCRRSGSVGPGIAGMRGINDAGDVPCPGGVEWKRE